MCCLYEKQLTCYYRLVGGSIFRRSDFKKGRAPVEINWWTFSILVGFISPIILPWWFWGPWGPEGPPDPPPQWRDRRVDWVTQLAGAVGGVAAWAGLGRSLAPDGDLGSLIAVSAVGALAASSVVVAVIGRRARPISPT